MHSIPSRPVPFGLAVRRLVGTTALVLGVLAAGAAHAQTLRPEVYVANGTVNATAVSDDGQTLYIGGNFTYVGPNTGSGARLSETAGTVLPGGLVVNGPVAASVADGAGGFYIGGAFTQVGGVGRNRIAHVLPDGTLDAAFDPNANAAVNALAVSGGVLYAGGEFESIGGQPRQGLAAFSITPVASEGTETSARAVGPAYPNPAMGRATLPVSVAQTERVRVDVYNVLGQYVLTAFDGPFTAGATQSVTIETSRLAAGSYVVRVQGASFAETRRLTVVR